MGLLSRQFALALIALLIPAVVHAHQAARRSLSFGPSLKGNFTVGPFAVLDSRDPHEVARAFLRRLAYRDGSYFIRKDSYTEENTGISHVYVRQLIGKLEVPNGNINLNIRDGQVLSYGNSFFDWKFDSSILSSPDWHQAVYCSNVPTRPNDPACGAVLSHLQATASRHAYDLANYRQDPRAAAFFLLQVAHPDPASLAVSLSTLKAQTQDCADLCTRDIPCKGWLVSGHSNELGPIHARQVYIQTPGANGSTNLNLAWRLEMPLPDNHYIAYVSVHDPTKIISVADMIVDAPTPDSDGLLSTFERYVFGQLQEAFPSLDQGLEDSADAATPILTTGSYRVWKWGVNDPDSGERTLEVAPRDRSASPLGWHSMPAGNDPLRAHSKLNKDTTVTYSTTVGNNVIAQESWNGGDEWQTNGRADGGPDLVFDFPYEKNSPPRQYANTSITQLFYIANTYHDLLYLYGFDEVSGNFQQHNFGKGGQEGDAVIMKAQDGKRINNASFNITADGQESACRMHLWDTSKPSRDGGLDAGILIHELSHGLSGRLTGGPCDQTCLGDVDSAGLGEGWSDIVAITVRSTSTYKDYPLGAWATNREKGARHFLYSTNTTVNPILYDRLESMSGNVHDIGEIWAEILYVVSNKLIEKHGFADSLFPSSDSDFYRFVRRSNGVLSKVPKHGNALMLQLIVNAMKSQPCNPSFLHARDAIIATDQALTEGENKCTLWKAFASRGMGTNAKHWEPKNWFIARSSINGFEVPSECK